MQGYFFGLQGLTIDVGQSLQCRLTSNAHELKLQELQSASAALRATRTNIHANGHHSTAARRARPTRMLHVSLSANLGGQNTSRSEATLFTYTPLHS